MSLKPVSHGWLAGLFCLVIAGIAFLVAQAVRSPLFTIKNVEIEISQSDRPVSPEELQVRAQDALKSENIFLADLRPVEQAVLESDWVHSARIEKKLPETLVVHVVFREPAALIRERDGASLRYLDREGKVFGEMRPDQMDLPVLTGFNGQGEDVLRHAVSVIESWRARPESAKFSIDSVSYQTERGIRLLVKYPIEGVSGSRWVRGWIEANSEKFLQTARALEFLSTHGIAARRLIWQSDKKMVVRTALDS